MLITDIGNAKYIQYFYILKKQKLDAKIEKGKFQRNGLLSKNVAGFTFIKYKTD